MHNKMLERCDIEFDKLMNHQKNKYHRISKKVTKLRDELGWLAKESCPNMRGNPKIQNMFKIDCRYCIDCNLSLVSGRRQDDLLADDNSGYRILNLIKCACH